jgi:hypothetical protein
MPERQAFILRDPKKGRVYCAAPFAFGILFQVEKALKNGDKSGAN